MIERLRTATRERHAAVERAVDLRRSLGSLREYAHLLQRLWRLHALWEPACRRALRDDVFFDARRKTPCLLQDFSALGIEPSKCAQTLQIPSIESRSSALGAMYVVEGATLGGEILYREAKRRLGINELSGAAFLYGYGPYTAEMWLGFQRAMANPAFALSADEAIATAIGMFDAFEAHLAASD